MAAILIAILPILLWPLLALFVIAGCAGNLHAGISCPPILGIRFHSLPTDLLQLSVKGLAVSLPVGLVGLGLCRSIAGKRSGKSH